MENSLTNISKSTEHTIIRSETNAINKSIIEQFELKYDKGLNLDDAIIDIELDDSFFDCDDSDKLQVCHQTAFTIDSSNYITSIIKRSNIKLIPIKFSHQITYKINNNDNDNYNNGNDNENNSNNNNNQNIDNYNNNNNNDTRNKFENNHINDNKNNNTFGNIKTEDQRELFSRHEIQNNIEKKKTTNKIFNLMINATILN